jgi:hypothetical protein
MVAAKGSEPDICASCGGPGDELAAVHRIYLTVDEAGRMTGSETVDELERWCRSCRAMYPNLPEGAEAS